MFQSISLGLANVAETDFEKKLLLAKRHGFSAVESSAQEVMENGTENVRALLEKARHADFRLKLPAVPPRAGGRRGL